MAIRILSRKCLDGVCFVFLFLILFCLCEGQDPPPLSPMEKEEQQAIYSVIQGFVGKWWNGSELYPDPCGWTPIQGVSCEQYDDGLWYVTSLSLGPVLDNSLTCSNDSHFPEELFNLKHLKVLSVSSCFLSPTKNPVKLPVSNWESLTENLESLILRSNPGLVGTIPSNFGSLRNLQSLVLLENGLNGELPPSVCNNVKLKQLVLSGNNFVGKIPLTYGGFNELLIFDASRNNLSGSLPSQIGSLSSLLKLDLSNNNLDGELPRELGMLKNLTLLDLSHNKLKGGLVGGALKDLVSMKDLVLSNNPIGGDLLGVRWGSFIKMETLDLSNMGLEGIVPESMLGMRTLRFLDLSNNNLNGILSKSLENLPCLEAFHVNGNNLTGRLEFSQGFYGKLGRRFAAWNNANLCYNVSSSSSTTKPKFNVPYGVRPCAQEITESEGDFSTVENVGVSEGGNYDYEGSFVGTSLGSSSCVFNWLWLVFALNGVLYVLLWNMSF